MKSHNMGDLRVTMRAAASTQAVRTILSAAENRLANIEFIGWPALEESLRRELKECQQIARERGFSV